MSRWATWCKLIILIEVNYLDQYELSDSSSLIKVLMSYLVEACPFHQYDLPISSSNVEAEISYLIRKLSLQGLLELDNYEIRRCLAQRGYMTLDYEFLETTPTI